MKNFLFFALLILLTVFISGYFFFGCMGGALVIAGSLGAFFLGAMYILAIGILALFLLAGFWILIFLGIIFLGAVFLFFFFPLLFPFLLPLLCVLFIIALLSKKQSPSLSSSHPKTINLPSEKTNGH